MKNSELPSFRQRLQWQMPKKLGFSDRENLTAPQQQLPEIMGFLPVSV